MTSTPMSEDRFWTLIDEARARAGISGVVEDTELVHIMTLGVATYAEPRMGDRFRVARAFRGRPDGPLGFRADLVRFHGDLGEVLLETGGSLPIEQVPAGVRRIVDVKCPASGEAARNHWDNLRHLRAGDELKFVLADRDDYLWARDQVGRRGLDRLATVLFSAVHETLDPAEMARWILEDGLAVRAQVQLHKVLWPAATRGV